MILIRGFAMLDVLIGGTIVGSMASICLIQLGAARDLSTIAARDQTAARLVSETLEARRSIGADAACAFAGGAPQSATVFHGGQPYAVTVTTANVNNESFSPTALHHYTLRACDVQVNVTFTPSTGQRAIVASTRLYR